MPRRIVLAGFLVIAVHATAAGRPPPDELAALNDLAARATRELDDNILPFWIRHVRDPAGGFHGEVRADLSVNTDAPRGALLSCRILWTYAAALRRDDRPEYRAMAAHARDDLHARYWDAGHGGFFWTIGPDGSPLATHKQVYLQSFGIYALSEYHRATGDAIALDRAVVLFHLLETHARDPLHGGYFEAFTRDWSREAPEYRRMIGGTAPKSQNTHLHLMEAYTGLLRARPDPAVKAALEALVVLMLERILDTRTHHLGLFFAADWTPASTALSYGHDIEAAWLLCDAAGALGDTALLARTRAVAVDIARATLRAGVASTGAIHNAGEPGRVTDARHEWWPQAEAAVGFLNAYQISGDAEFLHAAGAVWGFIEHHVVDREHGEWHHTVSPDGRPEALRPKAGLWKCPYHNGRACMELADRVAALRGR